VSIAAAKPLLKPVGPNTEPAPVDGSIVEKAAPLFVVE